MVLNLIIFKNQTYLNQVKISLTLEAHVQVE